MDKERYGRDQKNGRGLFLCWFKGMGEVADDHHIPDTFYHPVRDLDTTEPFYIDKFGVEIPYCDGIELFSINIDDHILDIPNIDRLISVHAQPK